MFVEKLSYDQKCEVAQRIISVTTYRFQVEMHYGKKPYLEIFMYDHEYGNYSVCLYDTYLSCKYRPCNKNLEEMAKKGFKALYDIFGSSYKDYFLQQVNQIFM